MLPTNHTLRFPPIIHQTQPHHSHAVPVPNPRSCKTKTREGSVVSLKIDKHCKLSVVSAMCVLEKHFNRHGTLHFNVFIAKTFMEENLDFNEEQQQ